MGMLWVYYGYFIKIGVLYIVSLLLNKIAIYTVSTLLKT